MLPLFITFPQRCSVPQPLHALLTPPTPPTPPLPLSLPPPSPSSSFWRCSPRCPLLVLVTLRPCLSTRMFLPFYRPSPLPEMLDLSPLKPVLISLCSSIPFGFSSWFLTHSSFALLFPFCPSIPSSSLPFSHLPCSYFLPSFVLPPSCFILVYPQTLPGLHHLSSVTPSFSQSVLALFPLPPSYRPPTISTFPLSSHPSSHFPLTFRTFLHLSA